MAREPSPGELQDVRGRGMACHARVYAPGGFCHMPCRNNAVVMDGEGRAWCPVHRPDRKVGSSGRRRINADVQRKQIEALGLVSYLANERPRTNEEARALLDEVQSRAREILSGGGDD